MEEKIYDLLERLYIEMQEMKSNMATKDELSRLESKMATKDELSRLESKMATKDDITRLENNMVRMENQLKDDIRCLYDGYKQCIEGISTANQKIDSLTEKVENQEIKLQVVKSAK